MPAQAAPSASTQAAALTVPPAVEKKKSTPPPPKSAPTKTQSKRTAPAEKEADPAAKRQKIKASLTAKASRLEEKKKEEEEKKRKAERNKTVRVANMKKVEERALALLEENILIQSCLLRCECIPFTPDESEVCTIDANLNACKKTINEMVESKRYIKEEQDFIRKLINSRAPTFNSEQSERFNLMIKEMTSRFVEETEERRANHPDVCFIEDFISDELKEAWNECRVKFIKAYYYWKVIPFQESTSKLDALNNFMVLKYDPLRRMIFIEAERAEPKKKIIKVPKKIQFSMPTVPNSYIPNRRILGAEVDEALELESMHRESTETPKTMKPKVYAAYFTDKS